MKLSSCLLLLISISAVAGNNLRARKLRKDSEESAYDRSCTDKISLKFYQDEKCFEDDGSNDVNLCDADAKEEYEALKDGRDWCKDRFDPADDEETNTFKLNWDDDNKWFEPAEDDGGSNDNDIGHEAEKRLKHWEGYFEYDPSGNSRDRKLSGDGDCTISLKFYEDEKCFEEDGSNDVNLCDIVAEDAYESLKDGDDWCKGSFDPAEDEKTDTVKLNWDDDNNCFKDAENRGVDKLKHWEGYCDYSPNSGNSRD
jgi:hypothetical protein